MISVAGLVCRFFYLSQADNEGVLKMNCITGKVITKEFIIPYIKFGTGEKTLIIIPGLSVQSVIKAAPAIEKQYEVFCKDYTVYLFARREDMPESYCVYDMAEDTSKAMKELGISNACLFGVSQGGMIAMMIAAEHPDSVLKLALGSSAARLTEDRAAVLNEWLSLAEKGDAEKLYLSFGEKVYSAEIFAQYKNAFKVLAKTVNENDLKRFITLVKGTEGFNACDRMSTVKCPVLAIGDTDDKVLGVDSTLQIAELQKDNPCFEMYIYSGYGHAVYDTAPDYTQRLYDFFND